MRAALVAIIESSRVETFFAQTAGRRNERPAVALVLKPQTAALDRVDSKPGESALLTLTAWIAACRSKSAAICRKSNEDQDVLSFSGEYPGADEPVVISFPKLICRREATCSMLR
jgi:hypothetical protein